MPAAINTTDLEKLIFASIDHRYQSHTTKNLADYVFSNYLFQSFQPAFIDFVHQYRQAIADYLSNPANVELLVEYCIRATKAYTYQRNQFINFTRFYDDMLYAEYTGFFRETGAVLEKTATKSDLAATYALTLKNHHEKLRLILSAYCSSYQPTELPNNSLLNTVPCEEYSARLQLRLLGLNPARLPEPVLDIGCGAAGMLVNYMRGQGCAAFGLDRFAPAAPNFFQQDWFDFDYGQNAWGAIIAHQSFSTHFIHAHLNSSTGAARFARLYMNILASLKPGAAFYYAPGLPFFESQLAQLAGYSISKTIIEADNSLGIGEIFYSAKIKKLS